MTIGKNALIELRERTGLGMMDCRKALEETGNDIEAAIELLRKKGAAVAVKRSGKETSQGVVQSYIHAGSKLGVLVEINCETDFVARTQDMTTFAHDLCMHIAASKPLFVSPDEVDQATIAREKEIARAQLAGSGKPEKIIETIIEGKINAWYKEVCLLQQPFVKDDKFTVAQLVEQLIAKTGENIKIRRFARFEIGL